MSATMDSSPEPQSQDPVPALPPATVHDRVAWGAMALGLFLVLEMKLLPALLAGLLVHSLIHGIAGRLSGKFLSHHKAKLVALSLVAAVVIGATAALVLLLLGFLHGKLGHLPSLLDRMAGIIEAARDRMGWQGMLPATAELKETLAHALRGHAGEIERRGGELGRALVHALAGIVIGAITAFETGRPAGPLALSLRERVLRLSDAFRRVVFAQIRISLLNTTLTAAYLLVALPLFGIEIHYRKTLVLITFIVGLIPVLGNLISNTAIVVLSLGSSLPVAISSLVYLVVVHKLEYFLNARIVGGRIHASAWELLIAMLVLEAAFGISGVIAAPILYAYAKGELAARGQI